MTIISPDNFSLSYRVSAGNTYFDAPLGGGFSINGVPLPQTNNVNTWANLQTFTGGMTVPSTASPATRYTQFLPSGPVVRVDDNGAGGIGQILQNFGVTGPGQGIHANLVFFGTGGVATATPALRMIGFTTDTWAAAGSQSAEWQFYTIYGGTAIGGPALSPYGYWRSNGNKRLTANLTATTTGIAMPVAVVVESGKTYAFHAVLFVTADATGGHKYAMSGTCDPASMRCQVQSTNNGGTGFTINSMLTTLNNATGAVGGTTVMTEMKGFITTRSGGTLGPAFGQQVASGTSTLLAGSTFIVTEIA